MSVSEEVRRRDFTFDPSGESRFNGVAFEIKKSLRGRDSAIYAVDGLRDSVRCELYLQTAAERAELLTIIADLFAGALTTQLDLKSTVQVPLQLMSLLKIRMLYKTIVLYPVKLLYYLITVTVKYANRAIIFLQCFSGAAVALNLDPFYVFSR